MSDRITQAAELRRKAMCRTANLRPVRTRAESRELKCSYPRAGNVLHCQETLRHGVQDAVECHDHDKDPETPGAIVSTQPTVFVDVPQPQLPVIQQAFGTRTLSGVGAFDREPGDSFMPEYAPPLPDRPFLDWLKDAAVLQELTAPERPQPIRVPTVVVESSVQLAPGLQCEIEALSRAQPQPQPMAARVQPVAEQASCTWIGGLCAIGLLALSMWPFETNALAYGRFQRYSQLELAVSPLQAPVVAVHVVVGQRVQAGSPLISLDASALEHELSELNVTLDKALVAQVQAQALQQDGIAGEQLPEASEAEQLAHTVADLREQRVALQRKLHSRQVVAAHSGIVTQVLPALGEVVESAAPVVRIVPDNPALRLIAHFNERDAKDLRVAKQAILTVGADEMVVGAQVVRVHEGSVELRLDDATSVPELDRQLRRDAKVSLEFERTRSLFALAAERLRNRR